MNPKHTHRALLGLTALGLAPFAQAQQIEEVTVTATRREESAQTVPISITAVSADTLENARVESVRDLAMVTPGLNVNARSNVWIPYIRGIGAQDTSGGQESGVAIYVDGVYMSTPHAGQFTFNSLERIEVLKGPQGTLFGRNATGGLIHIITKDPTHEGEAYGKVSYGDFETAGAQFYIGGGLGDTVAADFAVNYFDQGKGYSRNLFDNTRLDGDNGLGFRSKWIWEPSDGTKFTFIGDYQKRHTAQGDIRSIAPGSVSADGSVHQGGFYDVTLNFPTYGDVKNYGASLKWQQDVGAGKFVSISALRKVDVYNTFDNDGMPTSFVEAEQYLKVKTFTQEVQYLSDGNEKLDWIVGGFYMNDTNGYVQPGGLRLSGLAFPVPFLELVHAIDTESLALFAEGTWKLNDSTRIVTGARITRDEKQLHGVTQFRVTTTGPATLLGPPLLSEKAVWTKPSFRLAAEHDVRDGLMVYGSFNRGFRSGSFNTVNVSGTPVNPETSNAYEVGMKSQWLNNRLRLNTAAFFTDFKDLQVVISRGPSTDLVNAGAAEVKGLEIDLEAALTENFTVRASTSVLDAKYTKFDTGNLCQPRLPNGTTGSVSCSPKGNDMVRTPPLTFNLGLSYETPVSFGKLRANVDVMWTDKFFWELDNRLQENSYALVNGQVGWSSADEHWGVNIFGRNLTDEKYAAFQVAQGGLNDQYSPAPPRMMGVEVNFKF